MAFKVVVAFFLTFIFHSKTVLTARNIIPSIPVCNKLPNEEFAIDLGRCQNTCEYYGRTWDCPTNYYKPKGDCYCKPGFARFQEDGKCVSVTNNATCKARLPIQPAACNGPNEIYTESLQVDVYDKDCLTFGRSKMENAVKQIKWGPNCICGKNDKPYTYNPDTYTRLSSGTCVLTSDSRCVAEFQPSQKRCEALGQTYSVIPANAPCQPSCYGQQYCPPPGPSCVCPPNKLTVAYNVSYYTTTSTSQWGPNPEDLWYTQQAHPITVLACYSAENCPETVYTQVAGR